MSDPAQKLMTSDEFLLWAMTRPEGERYEMANGAIVAMAPERSAHALTKLHIARRFAEAIEAAGLPCTAYPDGVLVEVDARTIYEPDAMVRCGPKLPDDAVKVLDPMIVVEVLSPSTQGLDAGAKLEDYFRIPSVRHYLILKIASRSVIHHFRDAGGNISTRIVREGPITLDPPGITVADAFPPP